MGVTLIGGGVRSGKSRFGLELGRKRFANGAFIATAEARDAEMVERIRRHRAERGSDWTTIEEPLDLAGAIERAAARFDGCVVDCLTLWLSNVMLSPAHDADEQIDRLILLLETGAVADVIVITNEVGCGIVPENELARRYRDLAGGLNQRVAALADEVYWMAFGVPVELKALAASNALRSRKRM
ncbi:MAG: bifunctional adenosylcobinamide kinase/adenosylcobinamide-phosphate guanylyltransferase [Acidobacteria bacterium]|nr:bifunctional adenosylcobinamide kinase/adenosylcobinamide-phosphate guanylyltransferase [Acidobacteriota bacterium]